MQLKITMGRVREKRRPGAAALAALELDAAIGQRRAAALRMRARRAPTPHR